MTLPHAHALIGSTPPHAAPPDHRQNGMTAGRPDRVWEMRRALGRRLAALRTQAGFSQWEFAPLTGYSRSTLSDAELGRHRLRREFWLRCDAALVAGGALVAAYDRIETTAAAMRRKARSQAQAAREEQASQRLQALLPVAGAEAGAAGPGQAGADEEAGAGEPDAAGGGAGEAGAEGAGAGAPRAAARPAVLELCPHCRQPVAVMILVAPPGAMSP
jgi:transcriptional regulator with XRE-family HTH domain